MTIRSILHYPHPKLRELTTEIDVAAEAELITDLKETATAHRAEGLAANQLGETKRVFVIKDGDEYTVCANPKILGTDNSEILDAQEGCLSFPGVTEPVKRAGTIHVSYQDETGASVERHLSGLAAVAFQHEFDHLNGVVFIDHMGKLQKHLLMKKMKKVEKRSKIYMQRVQAMLDKRI